MSSNNPTLQPIPKDSASAPAITQPTNNNDGNSNPNLSNDKVVAPTRTMSSDQTRADNIESERSTASKNAIEQIKALEKALEESVNNLQDSSRSDQEVDSVPAPNTNDNIVPSPKIEKDDLRSIHNKPSNDLTPVTGLNPKVDPRISALKQEIARIEKNKLEYLQKRSSFTKREAPIKKEIEALNIKEQSATDALEPFLQSEKSIDQQIELAEAAERAATTPEEKHSAENKRWQYEDKRHELESKKWEAQRALEEIASNIKQRSAELESIQSEAQSIDDAITQSDNRIKELELEVNLVQLSTKKEGLELKWVDLNEQKRDLETKLEETKVSESIIEEQADKLNENAKSATDVAVKREYEQERRKIAMERRELEKNRWSMEQKLIEIEQQVSKLKPEYQKALDAEKEMYAALEELKADHSEHKPIGSANHV